MIKIENIQHGWLDLMIGDKKFICSYLEDVRKTLDYLFDFGESPKRIYLDGEGEDLYLTAWKDECNDTIIVVWEEYGKEETLCTFRFDYSCFIDEWRTVCNDIESRYSKHFLMEDGDE